MYAPRNLGADYAKAVRCDLSAPDRRPSRCSLYPFFLDGVALHPDLIQPDGLHPNAAGVAVIVKAILPAVTKLLGSAGK